jgi:membrane fusion protein, multidrug efflux system
VSSTMNPIVVEESPIPPALHDDHVALPVAPEVSRTRLFAGVIGGVALLSGLFVAGWLPRRAAAAAAVAAGDERAAGPRRAEVVKPRLETGAVPITLTGGIEALRETAIWARASGYVRTWRVDIGDRVEKGQVLVELDTPELDQQLAQAQADLASRRAAIELARANAAFSRPQALRYESLVPQGLAAQQDLDAKRAAAAVDLASVHAAEAALLSQEAEVRRLTELRSFARVTAPFAGIITARNVEEGTLVTAGTSGGAGLFRLATTSPVRVFIQVPQALAPSMRAGTAAQVRVREYPDRVFVGTVTRTAGALDPASRTLRTEVQVPNPGGELLAGVYAQVALETPSSHRTLYVPSAAVMADAHGTHVAVLGDDGRLRFAPVHVERDTGAEAAIVSGLDGTERVVTNPGEDTVEGAAVVPVERTRN